MDCCILGRTKRISRTELFDNAVLRALFRSPMLLFRLHLGWLLGHRFLLLTHRGRRTGALREVVLEVVHREPERNAYVVVAGFGEDADWFRNLQANGFAEISVGHSRFVAVSRRLSEADAATVLATYEREHPLLRPAERWLLSHLLGWRYDGSPRCRLRAAREIPVVEFVARFTSPYVATNVATGDNVTARLNSE